MVILTIHYLDSRDTRVTWNTEPMSIGAAMGRVMLFVQSGVDVINHKDSGRMDVLLMHRVTGITLTPVD